MQIAARVGPDHALAPLQSLPVPCRTSAAQEPEDSWECERSVAAHHGSNGVRQLHGLELAHAEGGRAAHHLGVLLQQRLQIAAGQGLRSHASYQHCNCAAPPTASGLPQRHHSTACSTHHPTMGTPLPPSQDVPCCRTNTPSITAKSPVASQFCHCCLELHPILGRSRLLTDGREGKLAMLRPADWYFWRSAAVKGVLELLNMFARFCKFTACESLLLPCMLAKGDGRPGACTPQTGVTADKAIAINGLLSDASCMPISDDDHHDS